MRFHYRRSLLVAALAVGLAGIWPTVSASANPRPHPVKCGATWAYSETGIDLPTPPLSAFPGPATLTNCNQTAESGGGGTLSYLSVPAANGSSVAGTASVSWANGATSTLSYTESTVLPGDSFPFPHAYHACSLGQPVILAVVRLAGVVTGNTVVGANDPGVKGPVKALICVLRGPGEVSDEGFALAKHKKFQF
jgi:hypothetical protein